jgi:hypothetical protein
MSQFCHVTAGGLPFGPGFAFTLLNPKARDISA